MILLKSHYRLPPHLGVSSRPEEHKRMSSAPIPARTAARPNRAGTRSQPAGCCSLPCRIVVHPGGSRRMYQIAQDGVWTPRVEHSRECSVASIYGQAGRKVSKTLRRGDALRGRGDALRGGHRLLSAFRDQLRARSDRSAQSRRADAGDRQTPRMFRGPEERPKKDATAKQPSRAPVAQGYLHLRCHFGVNIHYGALRIEISL